MNNDRTRIVLLGGGHSHVEVLRRFGQTPPPPNTELVLVSREINTPYSGMVPGYIAGRYPYADCLIALEPLARECGARLIWSAATAIDPENKTITLADRDPISFDLLSIDIGSSTNLAQIEGAAEHAIAIKPLERFAQQWERVQARAKSSTRPLNVTIIGGGAGGVEVALSAESSLRKLSPNAPPHITLIAAGRTILPTHNKRVQRKFERILKRRNITLQTNAPAIRITPDQVICSGIDPIVSDETLIVTGATPAPWILDSGLALDPSGFIFVDEFLRSVSHPFVWATGDIATMQKTPRPKSGVFAVRQGPPLHENLSRTLRNEPLQAYEPQKKFLSLIGTGEENAVASRGHLALEGSSMWSLKRWIDLKWKRMYEPGAMSADPPMDEDEPMLCGGCGCKVGSQVLDAVLQSIATPSSDFLITGLNEPDDAAITQTPPGQVNVTSLDFFRTFIDDDYLMGKVTANHCLSDLHAMGATPAHALAIVGLQQADEHLQATRLKDLLDGARSVFEAEGAAIVGGHTIQGEEPILGFSVTGFADPEKLLNKKGARPGDQIILTKPIGTGTIMAGHMRGLSPDSWLRQAFEQMLQSNQAASKIFVEQNATACTDITGFGVAGHLLEILSASAVSANLELAAIPCLQGAVDLNRQQVRSTLFETNLSAVQSKIATPPPDDVPAFSLLFDPQTAGGLIATVPNPQAAECLAALKKPGYPQAAVIGEVTAAQPTSLSFV